MKKRIPLDLTLAMFKHANVCRPDLFLALEHMAPHFLKGQFLREWTSSNPTKHFDYVVTEWLLHYKAPPGSFAFRVEIPGREDKHYFVRWPDGTVVDLTAEQFEDWKVVDYAEAKKASMPDRPSHRAKVLNTLMVAQMATTALNKT